jgi:hypothetical protein
VLIVELKTERGSYQAKQMADYLRLARRKLPDAITDVALLASHRPGAHPSHDDRQRYAELTWHDVPALLGDVFPRHRVADALATFLSAELATTESAPMPATRGPAEIPARRGRSRSRRLSCVPCVAPCTFGC